MDPTLQFFLALAIIVLAAKASGYLSVRLGQPAVLGELFAGLLLGPSLLDMIHWPLFGDPQLAETLERLAELGVLFLMFIAGLDVDLEALISAGRPAVLAGVLGVGAPVILGAAVLLPFGFPMEASVLVGLVLAATSVSISAQTLLELGVLRTRVGVALLGAAIVDDVLVILLLSTFVAVSAGGGAEGLSAATGSLVRMLAFLGVGGLLGFLLIPRVSRWVDGLPISEGLIALAVVTTLVFAWAAELVGGVAAITGAFLAGLMFASSGMRPRIQAGVHAMSYSWVVPVFFVSIGLEANTGTLGLEGLPLALTLILVGVVSKVIGSGLGAWLGGFAPRDALRLGVGMASRGEVGLIVASVGRGAGLIGDNMFAAVVLMVLATTMLTPILLRALYPAGDRSGEAVEAFPG